MDRRKFTGIALAGVVPAGALEDAAVEANGWRLLLAPSGGITSLRNLQTELVNPRWGLGCPIVRIGDTPIGICDHPVRRRPAGGGIRFEYELPHGIAVDYTVSLAPLDGKGAALKHVLGIRTASRIAQDVTVSLPRNLGLPVEGRKVFLPLREGIGRKGDPGAMAAVFELAGACRDATSQFLALPMIDEYSDRSGLHLTCCGDPFFTTSFRLAPGEFNWTYPGKTGIAEREERTLHTVLHTTDFHGALNAFHRVTASGVNPGPAWLHDVAMVGYDYLSKGGQGWFADIDVLERTIAPADRPKVLLALHGWYDWVGRYTYDWRAKRLDASWTAFPNSLSPEFRKSAEGVPSFQRIRPIPMTTAGMHARLRYARSKGFRVALYFADGLTASEGAKDIHDPARVLKWEGWSGPETAGRSYTQNPLCPAVRNFYAGYLRTLLEEYGSEIDALVWDETHSVRVGETGPDACPGYADRAMMALVRDLARVTQSYRPDLALLASDNIGLYGYKAPYSLMAHGSYQDSSCRESIWPFGLFPNYRNVLWSCNWSPIRHFERTRYGVETFDTPVTIANGYAEDLGVSGMSREQLGTLLRNHNAVRLLLGLLATGHLLSGAAPLQLSDWGATWSPYQLVDDVGVRRRLIKATVPLAPSFSAGWSLDLRSAGGELLDTESIPPGRKGAWPHGFWIPVASAQDQDFRIELRQRESVMESSTVRIQGDASRLVEPPLRMDRLSRRLLEEMEARERTAVSGFEVPVESYLRQHDVVYRQPSTGWDEGLPLGNGDVGALVSGTKGREQVFHLDKTDIWMATRDEQPLGRSYAGTLRVRYGDGTRRGEFLQRLRLGTAEVETRDGSYHSVARVHALRNQFEVEIDSDEVEIALERTPVTLWADQAASYHNASRLYGSWRGGLKAGDLPRLRAEAEQAPHTLVEWRHGTAECWFVNTIPNLRYAVVLQFGNAAVKWKQQQGGGCAAIVQRSGSGPILVRASISTSRESTDPAARARR
ncbi:MAG: hypothetical protein NTY38_16185, partial [Acidobacteria bacterium]|nr:hypothetical protein [Acidobacteriota bacterium]